MNATPRIRVPNLIFTERIIYDSEPDTPEDEHDPEKSILQNEPKRSFIFNQRSSAFISGSKVCSEAAAPATPPESRKMQICGTNVRPYGADYQWVKVPLQELSICLDS